MPLASPSGRCLEQLDPRLRPQLALTHPKNAKPSRSPIWIAWKSDAWSQDQLSPQVSSKDQLSLTSQPSLSSARNRLQSRESIRAGEKSRSYINPLDLDQLFPQYHASSLGPVVPPRKRTILRTRLNLRRFYIGFWPLVRPILRATPVPAVCRVISNYPYKIK